MGLARNWSKSEIEYLEENWGRVSIPTIMKNLNRSNNAIKIKAFKLGLGAFLESGEYVTFHQLLKALGVAGGGGYKITSWIKNRDFPAHTRRVDNNSFRIVYIDEFWKWAEKNQSFLDFTTFDENALGTEPDWAKLKRKNDWKNKSRVSTAPWTREEDDRLKALLKLYKHTYAELSKKLSRTNGAIQKRICDLGLKERPIKADNHIAWTQEEFRSLGEMIKSGLSYEIMADSLEKSSKALRGRVYQMYLTENLDKVRGYLGNGTWGDGRPARKVKNRLQMSIPEKEELKEDMSRLMRVLLQIAREKSCACEEFIDFWQKDMCMKWSDITGCSAKENSCDSCASFQRIQPQYCVRCGTTFFERQENIICVTCRVQRKKQAYKKYLKLGGGKNATNRDDEEKACG